ncbi:MAG: hypothetical protein ABFE07_12285 [Armatimonadia bacterium]
MSALPAPVLRPLNTADIIDLAIRLYRRNFGVFFGIIAIVYAPLGLMTSVMMYLIMSGVDPTKGPTPDFPAERMAYVGGFAMLIAVLYGLTVPLCEAALAVAVSRRYLGQESSVSDAYSLVMSRFWTLLGAVVLVALVTMAALVPLLTGAIFASTMLVRAAEKMGTEYVILAVPAAIVLVVLSVMPGLWIGVRFMFVGPIVAIERQGALEAMQRSWSLSTGHWWRVFGTAMLLGLLVLVATYTVSMPLSFGAMALTMVGKVGLGQALSQGIQTAVSMLLQPIWVSSIVLLYYDLRVRKEAFDLQLLAEAMQKSGKDMPLRPATLLPGQTAPLPGTYAPPAPLPPDVIAAPEPAKLPPTPLISRYGEDSSVITPPTEETDEDERDNQGDTTH